MAARRLAEPLARLLARAQPLATAAAGAATNAAGACQGAARPPCWALRPAMAPQWPLRSARNFASEALREHATRLPPTVVFREPTKLPEGMKFYKPTSPGQRHRVTTSRVGLWKGKPYMPLVEGKKRISGRNNTGRITVWHRGGGHKRRYRIVDFKRRDHWGVDGRVVRFEYDPNRSAHIALVRYDTEGVDDCSSRQWLLSPLPSKSHVAYVIAAEGMVEGQRIQQGPTASIDVGNALPLKHIPMGTKIHNIELEPKRGAVMARSAGTSATLLRASVNRYVMLRLTSGEQRLVHEDCMATIGAVCNAQHKNRKLGKAGAKRWLGFRPTVRGVAMNPVDHPHGGGEGKSSGGRPSCSPWGKPAKGGLTRKPRNRSDRFIVKGRPRGKKHANKNR